MGNENTEKTMRLALLFSEMDSEKELALALASASKELALALASKELASALALASKDAKFELKCLRSKSRKDLAVVSQRLKKCNI